MRCEEIMLPVATPLKALVHRARDSEALVLHLHGGAFVEGAPEGGGGAAALLARAGAAVVSPGYPLAPEHPFPQALEAAYPALEWLARRRHRFASARARLYVAGEDAGGNLAAALVLMARDRNGPTLDGALLLSPMLDACVGTASLRAVKAGPVGCPFADGWRKYLSRASDVSHPYAAPGAAARLAGLPHALLLTAVDDPLRDEAVAFAQRLRDAGVAAHDVVLPLATGWPRAWREPLDGAAWAEPARAALERFLFEGRAT